MIKLLLPIVISAGAAAAALTASVAISHRAAAEQVRLTPAPAVDEVPKPGVSSATAVFAGGCFWGVQGVFQHVKGVTSAVSGYAGGTKADASYQTVSSGSTGHAESVMVTYDPREITYGELLRIYFSVVADPTTLDAQGPDEGPQYRTDLFATTPEQAKIAKDYIAQLEQAHVYAAPIVTKISPFTTFYQAEGYHQNYLTLHPNNPYIAANDIPKVEGLKALFGKDYRPNPVLTPATN
ncbi:MAG: peptide-methionine (S)-S-oxide reductase MsrA [Beijerinckiaceae bacterium]|nr:peptide-methionine (S)-S-oxide reductase MsrA [Beijerinckiaceae bacterium]